MERTMLDHTAINVGDFARSLAFYRAALAPLGYRIAKQHGEQAAGFGVADGFGKSPDPGGDFWIIAASPHEPRQHVAFSAASRAQVDAFHAAALAAGGRDNGKSGLRPQYHANYYGAFIHDPDGYNIEAVFHGAG
jgi:catechol 2,3-dioxygenase-like lactoylglutathione lyase family enzyme